MVVEVSEFPPLCIIEEYGYSRPFLVHLRNDCSRSASILVFPWRSNDVRMVCPNMRPSYYIYFSL